MMVGVLGVVLAAGIFAIAQRGIRTNGPGPEPLTPPVSTVGRLEVTSTPTGASVTIDGEAYGTTPLTVEELAVGEHEVLLESEAGDVRKTIDIAGGETLILSEAIFQGFVTVFAPVRLEIYEGGRLLGTTEESRHMLSPGVHELSLVNERLSYRSSITVEIQPGQVLTQSVQLPNGTVRITAEPWAMVSVDGESLGRTPLDAARIPIGIRQIVFTHPELGQKQSTVTVMLGRSIAVHMDMR